MKILYCCMVLNLFIAGLIVFMFQKKKGKTRCQGNDVFFIFSNSCDATHLKVGTPFLIHHPVTRLGRESGKGGGGGEGGGERVGKGKPNDLMSYLRAGAHELWGPLLG